jgi:hypothetical protein
MASVQPATYISIEEIDLVGGFGSGQQRPPQ